MLRQSPQLLLGAEIELFRSGEASKLGGKELGALAGTREQGARGWGGGPKIMKKIGRNLENIEKYVFVKSIYGNSECLLA